MLLGTLCLLFGCHAVQVGSAATAPRPAPSAPPSSGTSGPKYTDSPSTSAQHPLFDGQKAFKLLEAQCAFGPRPVGSAAHQKTRDYLIAELKKYADKVDIQDFKYKGLLLTNIIGVFNPDVRRSVLLCGHWDTRPTADEEIDEAKKKQPIPGASDGASEIAVLLELARNFKEQKPDVGVVIVLLDGEDYGSFEKDEGVFLGSRYFARHHQGYSPVFGILLDMVGDKDLNIFREGTSERIAPGTQGKVFRIARELGYGAYFQDRINHTISDDHVPISEEGNIPTIDLIDFDYKYWHTIDDTPDKCSAKSLEIVGRVVSEVVYRESGGH